VRVDPDDAETFVARRKPFDRADVRAAAAPEDERPYGQIRGDGECLRVERVLSTTDASG
jgi:hypothetical protein